MSGFPSGSGKVDNTPVILGQSIALLGTPGDNRFLPVGTVVNRVDYPELSNAYPGVFALQSTAFAATFAIPWADIAYGNGVYVAIGGANGTNGGYDTNTNNQSVITSTDGVNWVTRTNVLPVSQFWSGIAFGNGVFVAVSNTTTSSCIAYSTDGISWTGVYPAAIARARIAFGNGIFVAFSSGATYYTSTDGATWTARSYSNQTTTWGCTFQNGKFWRTTMGTVLQYSTDGISWGTATLPSNVQWGRLVWNGSMYLVSATNNAAYATSSDGLTWSGRSFATIAGCACTIGSMFVVFSGTGTATGYFSTDGLTWNSFSSPTKAYCLFEDGTDKTIIIANGSSTGYIYRYGQSPTITLNGTSGQFVRVR